MNTFQNAEIGGLLRTDAYMRSQSLPGQSVFPEEGKSWADVQAALVSYKRDDYPWRAGRLPLYVYYDDEALLAVSREAYNLYFSENALGGRAFPSLVSMEHDIVDMCRSLFHAPDGSDGSFTSGGTESIFLALKTARDHYKQVRRKLGKPTVIVPRTAHPAFDKAGHYLDVEVRRIGIDRHFRADILATQNAIDDRTMMIVGSAPCYPYGVFDPISQLAALATSAGLWFHVDACLGGFLAPFARHEGYPIPDFDFSIPGVTSLSADMHKYGFSARGASVLLYRSASFLAHQEFQFSNWPRGGYSTRTFLGSRPGGSVASAWAVSQYLGKTGYRRLARKIMEAKERLIVGIDRIAGMEVLRPSELCIVVYRSVDEKVDIDAVAECLGERGWFVGRMREPSAVHFALNAVHAPIIDEYLHDLTCAVKEVRESGRIGKEDGGSY